MKEVKNSKISRRILLTIDLDGTLLTNEKEITQRTLDYLKESEKFGIQICIATARTFEGAKKITDKYNLNVPLICANGAMIKESVSLKEYNKIALVPKDIMNLTEYIRKKQIPLRVFTDTNIYTNVLNENEEKFNDKNRRLQIKNIDDVKDWNKVDVIKMTIRTSHAQIKDLAKWIWERNLQVNITYSDISIADITHKKATKGNGLKILAGTLGYKRNQILAIGNYFNDIDMFNSASLGIAMANSPIEVKEKADIIIKSNEEEGVADFLEEFIRLKI